MCIPVQEAHSARFGFLQATFVPNRGCNSFCAAMKGCGLERGMRKGGSARCASCNAIPASCSTSRVASPSRPSTRSSTSTLGNVGLSMARRRRQLISGSGSKVASSRRRSLLQPRKTGHDQEQGKSPLWNGGQHELNYMDCFYIDNTGVSFPEVTPSFRMLPGEANHVVVMRGGRPGIYPSRVGGRQGWNKEMNTELVMASGLDDLLALLEPNHCYFDAINVATGLRGLAKHWQAGLCSPEQAGRLLALVERLCIQVVAGSVSYGPRTLASCAHSLARLGCRVPDVWVALGRNIMKRSTQLLPQDISNILWAYATVRYRARPLFRVLAGAAAVQPPGAFKPQELGNTLWALASMGHHEAALFDALAVECDRQAADFNPQNISNVLWSYARVGQTPTGLFAKLGHQAVRCATQLTPQNLANCAWAFARAGVKYPPFFRALGRELGARGDDFGGLELGACAWATSRTGYYSPAVFLAISRCATARSKELSPRSLSNIMWAFAAVGHDAPQLFQCLVREAMSRSDLSPTELATIAWSHATLSYSTAAAAPLAELLLPRAAELSARELANAVWALAVLGVLEGEDLRRLQPLVQELELQFSGEGLMQLLQAELALGLKGASGACDSLLPPDLSVAARRMRGVALKQLASQQPSDLQCEVLQTLTTMGFESMFREQIGLILTCITVMLPSGSTVALEVEGPSRFTRTEPHRPLGGTLFRRRLLRRSGRNVISLPFFEWEKLSSDSARRSYLKNLLLQDGHKMYRRYMS